jgi:ABC-type nitrate/sulfonate/bicarbonate transport system permease component
MMAQEAKAISQRGLQARSLVSVLTIIVLWEAVARAGLASALFLPPFTKVISEWWAVCADGSLPLDLAASLSRAAVGLCLAAGIGIPLGIAMARSRFLHWLFDPVIALAFPSPKIAFLPIFILWFGIYSLSKILLVAFACVFWEHLAWACCFASCYPRHGRGFSPHFGSRCRCR